MASILSCCGYDVQKEYYINDSGRQIQTLGLSVYLRGKELLGETVAFPDTCYQGEYIRDLARELMDRDGPEVFAPDEADAIIFGCPTYMGSPSADMKRFMEASSGRWMEQKWADKLAAGFTNSGSWNGDKQNTLVSFLTLAAQHGMVWINLNLLPGYNSSKGSAEDVKAAAAALAMGDASAALAHGPVAAFYNPAGIANDLQDLHDALPGLPEG